MAKKILPPLVGTNAEHSLGFQRGVYCIRCGIRLEREYCKNCDLSFERVKAVIIHRGKR